MGGLYFRGEAFRPGSEKRSVCGSLDDGKRAPPRRFLPGRSHNRIGSGGGFWTRGKLALEHDGVFAAVGGLVIPAADAYLFESEVLIEADRRNIRSEEHTSELQSQS